MHTYIIYFRGFVVGSQSLLTWGFCPGSSRAPTSLCRRRGAPAGRQKGGGGGGGGGGVSFFELVFFVVVFCGGERRAPTSLCRRPRTGQFWSGAGGRRHNWRRR